MYWEHKRKESHKVMLVFMLWYISHATMRDFLSSNNESWTNATIFFEATMNFEPIGILCIFGDQYIMERNFSCSVI